jgi:hypothetical protein
MPTLTVLPDDVEAVPPPLVPPPSELPHADSASAAADTTAATFIV